MIANDIKTKPELIDYIKRKLGNPKLRIEISDSQIEQNINDAIQIYRQYALNEGNFRTYMVIDLIQSQNKYKLPDNVCGVAEIKREYGATAWVLAQMSGYAASSVLSMKNFDLVSFYMLNQWLRTIKLLTPSPYQFTYNNNTKILTVMPAPDADKRMFLQIYTEEDEENILNEIFIKKYSIALSKISLGEVRSKYNSIQGFGGSITLNGDALKNEGLTEKDLLEEDLILKFKYSRPPLPLFTSS